MKIVTLFRHARSSWKYPVADEFRPLNKRGHTQAMEMARRCRLPMPQALFTSSALRAASTAIIYKNELGIPDQVFRINEQIYTFDFSILLKFLQQISEQYSDVWLFGHNPCFTELAEYLLGEEIDDIITSGYVRISLQSGSWHQITPGCGNLVELNNRDGLSLVTLSKL